MWKCCPSVNEIVLHWKSLTRSCFVSYSTNFFHPHSSYLVCWWFKCNLLFFFIIITRIILIKIIFNIILFNETVIVFFINKKNGILIFQLYFFLWWNLSDLCTCDQPSITFEFQLMNFVMAVDILKTTMVEKLPSDLEGMETTMERLLALIDDVSKYVDSVVVRQMLVPKLHRFSEFSFHLIPWSFCLSGGTGCSRQWHWEIYSRYSVFYSQNFTTSIW